MDRRERKAALKGELGGVERSAVPGWHLRTCVARDIYRRNKVTWFIPEGLGQAHGANPGLVLSTDSVVKQGLLGAEMQET